MTDLLIRLTEISIHACILTLAVLVLRLIFKNAPKSLRCALWGLVALRLLLPFSIQSSVSLQPDTAPVRENMEYVFSAMEEERAYSAPTAEEFTTRSVTEAQTDPVAPAGRSLAERADIPTLLASVWLAGTAALLGYAAVSFIILRRRVAASLRLEKNVFVCDGIPSPFLLGILRPRIYLPGGLPGEQREYVLAHERTHIRRGDHILKPLAFLLASVYWFNPFVWLAYILFNRDLELACDERVIRGYDSVGRADYARTLLFFGEKKRNAALSPLAFGEVSVKTRVKQALSYKKPAIWILSAAVLVAAVAAVCLLTEPKTAVPVGVELLAENEAGEWNYYKILSDGTLRKKPDAPGGGYGGYYAGADCFLCREENGGISVQVIKTELGYSEGETVPVTEERETIFYAVAAVSEHEINRMEIFETHGADDQYYAAVEYKTDGGYFSKVFRFYPETKSLEELCSAANIRVINVYPLTPDGDLEEAVHDAILADQADKGWLGEFNAEGHILLGTKEAGDSVTVYVLHEFCSFGFENGFFVGLGGHSMPLALSFQKTEDGYRLLKIEYPEDGGHYADSVKRIFPENCRERILSHSDEDAEALWQKCVSQAEAYLESIGRTAEVRRDVDRTWLSSVIDPAVADKVIPGIPELEGYPTWIGTREQIENGVRYVYSTVYEQGTPGRVYFTKTEYGDTEYVESIIVDAQTGGIVEKTSRPVDDLTE